MTKVRLERLEDGQCLTVEGHQEGAPAGENVYCAAISAITACVVNALILEGCEHEVRAKDGSMKVKGPRGERADAFFDMAMAGFSGFRQKYPDRMEIED